MSAPILKLWAYKRARDGKEIACRISERFGQSMRERPSGKIIWIHAASNGEALSALPLIEYLCTLPSAPRILMTTMTVTAAHLIASRTDMDRVIHQFIPYDNPAWIEHFHGRWQPDMAIWVESELWPNHLAELKKREIPAVLLNARLSDKSLKKWMKAKLFFQSMMKVFDIVLAQTKRDENHLKSLGLENIQTKGNLKDYAPALPHDAHALTDIENGIGGRPVVLYASTHAPEEDIAFGIHHNLKKIIPDLLTIIVPRHPKRGEELANDMNRDDINIARRSLKMSIRRDTDIYIADTLGELGLFYAACPIVFVGNSLGTKPGGGHNLLEPAWFQCAILSGNDLHNFSILADEMPKANACKIVSDRHELENCIRDLLNNSDTVHQMADNAYDYVSQKQEIGMKDILAAIEPTCKKAGIL
jgi:3-deoxy-D-manno-octulosonic-acid transferase